MKPSEKPMKFVMTSAFSNHYGQLEPFVYIGLIKSIWKKYPYDMFIFDSYEEGKLQIGIQGYHLDTEAFLDKNPMFITDSLPIRKFWAKIDDYGNELICTFLFPEDY